MSEVNDSTSGSMISPNPLLPHQLSSDSKIPALLNHNQFQFYQVMALPHRLPFANSSDLTLLGRC